MNPSRAAIYEAIERLLRTDASPSRFQSLAESYAQQMFPDQFGRLVPRGANAQGVAIKGWPDAYGLQDGQYSVLEATSAVRWRSHLEQDLQRMQTSALKNTTHFLFVAWGPQPGIDEEQEWKSKFSTLGIAATLVFARQLTRDLTLPRFAPIWSDLLHLPANCYPFSRIKEVVELFGNDSSLHLFAPSRLEYEMGLVHRSPVIDLVEQQLERNGSACVRGKGATGKTVMATILGFDRERQGNPSYYFDLAKIADPHQAEAQRLFEVLSSRADDRVLFVVDNAHLQPELVDAMMRHWHEARRGSHLLLLSRFTAPGISVRGVGSLGQSFGSITIDLDNTPEDLLGVYRRLLRRRSASPPPEPHAKVVTRWFDQFGADLVAFSAALAKAETRLRRRHWNLDMMDATAYVRSEYLSGRPDENQTLLQIAAMTALELRTPASALESGPPRRSLRQGVALSASGVKGDRPSFKLVHPGLGELLLQAGSLEQVGLLIQLATHDPAIAPTIVARLGALGREFDASRVLQAALDQPHALAKMLTRNRTLTTAAPAARLVAQLSGLPLPALDDSLTADSAVIAETALTTPVHFLPPFFDFIQQHFPRTEAEVLHWLASDKSENSLAEMAVRTENPAHLISFLRYLKRRLPELYPRITDTLSKQIDVQLLRSPTVYWPNLIGFLKSEMSQIYEELWISLTEPSTLTGLVSAISVSPVADLTRVLKYFYTEFPDVHRLAIEELLHRKIIEDLLSAAFRDSLRVFLPLLDHIVCHAPKAMDSLTAELHRTAPRLGAETPDHFLDVVQNSSFLLTFAERQPRMHAELGMHLVPATSSAGFAASMLIAPIRQIPDFLEYARRYQPRVYSQSLATVQTIDFQRRLLSSFHDFKNVSAPAPLDNPIPLLEYLALREPQIHQRLLTRLAGKLNSNQIAEAILLLPLENLPPILKYLRLYLAELHAGVVETVSTHTERSALIGRVRRLAAPYLVSLLPFLKEHLPVVYSELYPDNLLVSDVDRFVVESLQLGVSDICAILINSRSALPLFYENFVAALNHENNFEQLLGLVERTPLDHLTSLFDMAGASLPRFLSRWKKTAKSLTGTAVLRTRIPQPQEPLGFVSFARVLSSLAEEDIAKVYAEWLITSLKPSRLSSDFGLKHLVALLYHGRSVEPEAVTNFVNALVTSSWIERQYSNAQAGTVARTLHTAWRFHPHLLGVLVVPALTARLDRELFGIHRRHSKELAGILRLLGSAELVGASTRLVISKLPVSKEVESAVRAVEPEPQQDAISGSQIQLWLGLRFLAHNSASRLSVDPFLGRRAQILLKNARPEDQRSQSLNYILGEWLASCAGTNWLLADGRANLPTL